MAPDYISTSRLRTSTRITENPQYRELHSIRIISEPLALNTQPYVPEGLLSVQSMPLHQDSLPLQAKIQASGQQPALLSRSLVLPRWEDPPGREEDERLWELKLLERCGVGKEKLVIDKKALDFLRACIQRPESPSTPPYEETPTRELSPLSLAPPQSMDYIPILDPAPANETSVAKATDEHSTKGDFVLGSPSLANPFLELGVDLPSSPLLRYSEERKVEEPPAPLLLHGESARARVELPAPVVVGLDPPSLGWEGVGDGRRKDGTHSTSVLGLGTLESRVDAFMAYHVSPLGFSTDTPEGSADNPVVISESTGPSVSHPHPYTSGNRPKFQGIAAKLFPIPLGPPPERTGDDAIFKKPRISEDSRSRVHCGGSPRDPLSTSSFNPMSRRFPRPTVRAPVRTRSSTGSFMEYHSSPEQGGPIAVGHRSGTTLAPENQGPFMGTGAYVPGSIIREEGSIFWANSAGYDLTKKP